MSAPRWRKTPTQQRYVMLLLGLLLMALSGCGQKPLLDRIAERGSLRVGVLLSPTNYHPGPEGPTGFEHDLVTAFAQRLQLEVDWVVANNFTELLRLIRSGAVDLAAGVGISEHRRHGLRFSQPYLQLTRVAVYRRGNLRPREWNDLRHGQLMLAGDGPHWDLFSGQDHIDPLRMNDASHLDLLDAVERQEIDYTITTEPQLRLNRQFLAHLAEGFTLDEPLAIAWAFPAFLDTSLLERADAFLQDAVSDGLIEELQHRHLEVVSLGLVDTRTFWRDVERRLPPLQPIFEQHAQETGWDWQLLAAIGYQESHWIADARSPTGVRGIMMLTQQTARDFGIESRLDPEQSIRGGALQLRAMERKIPPRITGEDRLWFTLAAYNLGYGHLEDARVLTQRLGGNPDSWAAVREHLPLLEDEAHHDTLKHGFARGSEALRFVEGVRTYRALLEWHSRRQLAQNRSLSDQGAPSISASSDRNTW